MANMVNKKTDHKTIKVMNHPDNASTSYVLFWRDHVGIEPTGDGTRLPKGFEDPGKHQLHIWPHKFSCSLLHYT